MRDWRAFASCHKAFTAFLTRGWYGSLPITIASIRVLSLENFDAFDILTDPTHWRIIIKEGRAGLHVLNAGLGKIYCRQHISVTFLRLDSTWLRCILPFFTFWCFRFLLLRLRMLLVLLKRSLSFIKVTRFDLTDSGRLIACHLSLGAIEGLYR